MEKHNGEAGGLFWVLLETGSNQKYIFSTTKQRLQVAASAAIWSLGYEWVEEAAQKAADKHGCEYLSEPAEIEQRFGAEGGGPDQYAGTIAHIVKASGKAYLLVPTRQIGEEIIHAITRQAMMDGTGIDVWGVVSDPIAANLEDAAQRLREATLQLEAQRYKRTGPSAAHPATPFHARCDYSNEVATTAAKETRRDARLYLRSAKTNYLFEEAGKARRRLEDALLAEGGEGLERALLRMTELDRGINASSWVGVIHADGNGVGKIFRNLADVKAKNADNPSRAGREFIIAQAKLSRGLEEITWDAFRQAVQEVAADHENSVLPILIGGDDVVVMVSGAIAYDFAVALTRRFQAVATDPNNATAVEFQHMFREIRDVLGTDTSTPASQNAEQLSMAAGVLLTKIKHPFHHSATVAEELTSFAKTRTRAESSVAVHVLYEPSLRPLDTLRDDAAIEGQCFNMQPIVVDSEASGVGTTEEFEAMLRTIRGAAHAAADAPSHGVIQMLREAVTEAPTVNSAGEALKAAKDRASELGQQDKLGLLSAIEVDTSKSEANLYTEESPTTFITALEVAAVLEAEEEVER